MAATKWNEIFRFGIDTLGVTYTHISWKFGPFSSMPGSPKTLPRASYNNYIWSMGIKPLEVEGVPNQNFLYSYGMDLWLYDEAKKTFTHVTGYSGLQGVDKVEIPTCPEGEQFDIYEWKCVPIPTPPTPPTPPPPEGPPPTGPPTPPPITLPPTPENWWDVAGWIHWLGEALAYIIKYLVDYGWNGASAILKPIIDYFWSLLPPWLQESLSGFKDWFKDPWSWFYSWIKPLVEHMGGEEITGSPQRWIQRPKPEPAVKTDVSWPWGGLVEALRASIGDFTETATRSVASAEQAQSTFPTTGPGASPLEIKPIARSPEAQVPEWKQKSDTLQTEYAARIFDAATKPMDELMAKSSPVDMSTAMTIAGSVTAAGAMITLAGVISGVGAEIASIGQVEEVGKGVREFIKLTGVPGLAKDFVTAPISMGVKPWVSRYYDQLFRTHIFSREEIDEFYIKDPTLENLWKQHYAWYGYPDSYIEQFKKYLRHWPSERLLDQMLYHKQLSPDSWGKLYRAKGWTLEAIEAWSKTHWKYPGERLLSRILDVVPEEEPQIRIWLEETGYDEAGVDKMVSVFYKLAYKDEVTKLIYDTVTDFVDGWSTPEQLETSLTDLGRPAQEVEYQVSVAKQKELRERRKLKLKILEGKAKRQEITLEVFQSEISALGLQPDRVELEVQSIVIEQPEVEIRELTIAEVRRLFKENLATEGVTRTRLAARNVPLDDTDLMIQDDYYSIFKDERTKLINNALDDLKFGSISPALCKERLLACQLRKEEADLRIADALVEHARDVSKELLDIYTKDFREDVQTEAQYRKSLEKVPLTSDRIDERVKIELERKKPAEAYGG